MGYVDLAKEVGVVSVSRWSIYAALAGGWAACLLVCLSMPAADASESACGGEPPSLMPLCITYCDDMQCNAESPEDPMGCERLLGSYSRLSGGDLPPCEGAP